MAFSPNSRTFHLCPSLDQPEPWLGLADGTGLSKIYKQRNKFFLLPDALASPPRFWYLQKFHMVEQYPDTDVQIASGRDSEATDNTHAHSAIRSANNSHTSECPCLDQPKVGHDKDKQALYPAGRMFRRILLPFLATACPWRNHLTAAPRDKRMLARLNA